VVTRKYVTRLLPRISAGYMYAGQLRALRQTRLSVYVHARPKPEISRRDATQLHGSHMGFIVDKQEVISCRRDGRMIHSSRV